MRKPEHRPECHWKALPKDLLPRSISWEYLDPRGWERDAEGVHHALYVDVLEKTEASPTTAIIDSQTAKGRAFKGGLRLIRPAGMPARRWSAASATS
jgi:hypothetical protein